MCRSVDTRWFSRHLPPPAGSSTVASATDGSPLAILEPHMQTASLYRLVGVAGVLTGNFTVFNVARRVGLIPTNTATHAVSTLATALALFALTGLYLWQRERTGTFGLVAFVVNFLGLAGVFDIEFSTHAIFPYLDPKTRDAVLAGETKGYFLVVAILFLVGVSLFGIASWRARAFPAAAIVLYVLGLVPAALRTSIPAHVYEAGLLVGAAAVVWMSSTVLRPAPAPVREMQPTP
jgi:hypothetical protein